VSAAERLAEAEEEIARIGGNDIHYRAANRLLKLCRDNGGVYIKIGQHLVSIFQTVRLVCQDSFAYCL
jgi:predicted unusual protein kinase regulating ubiquinone biosynthesis (AarF/ABC1/UbiB family)